MTAQHQAWRAGLGGWLVLAALAAGTACAGEQGNSPAKGKAGAKGIGPAQKKVTPGKKPGPGVTQPAAQAAEPLHLKTFAIHNADPEDLRTLLPRVMSSMTAAAKKGIGFRPPVGGTPTPRVVVDSNSRTVFVRGTEAQIGAVGDALAVLDAAPGEALPEGKNLGLIRLNNAKIQDVMKVLSDLGLSEQVVALGKSNSILVLPGAQTANVQEVISHLDKHSRAPIRKSGGPFKNKTGKSPAGGGAR